MQLLYDECRLLLKFHPGIFNEIMTKVLSTGSRTKNQGRDSGLQWTAPTHEQYSSTVPRECVLPKQNKISAFPCNNQTQT